MNFVISDAFYWVGLQINQHIFGKVKQIIRKSIKKTSQAKTFKRKRRYVSISECIMLWNIENRRKNHSPTNYLINHDVNRYFHFELTIFLRQYSLVVVGWGSIFLFNWVFEVKVSKMRILWNGIKKIRKYVHSSQVDVRRGLIFLTYIKALMSEQHSQYLQQKSAVFFNLNTGLVSRWKYSNWLKS